MDTNHVQTLISDYVLGLASAEERRQVERHMLICASCASALERERRVARLVRQVSQSAALPPARLSSLRPRLSGHLPVAHQRISRQLAPAMMILMLLFATVAVQMTGGDGRSRAVTQFGHRTGTPTLATPDMTAATTVAGRSLAAGPAYPAPVASGAIIPEVAIASAPAHPPEAELSVTPIPFAPAP